MMLFVMLMTVTTLVSTYKGLFVRPGLDVFGRMMKWACGWKG